MVYYSVPADFTWNTLNEYARLNQAYPTAAVRETYGQITQRAPTGSGRDIRLLPCASFQRLAQYIRWSHGVGIQFAYTLNAICLSNRELHSRTADRLCRFLQRLENIGVDTLIVAMPSLIELVKEKGFSFRVKASAVSQINQPYKARLYRSLGADSMVLDPDLVRNIPKLKEVAGAFDGETELIANNNCTLFCPYKMFHYCHEAHACRTTKETAQESYYFYKCNLMKYETPSSYLKMSWIRPEDIAHYQGCGVANFKIQGRQDCARGDIVKTVKAYFEQRYCGNFVSLLTNFNAYHSFLPEIDNRMLDGFIVPFFEKGFVCSGNCTRCHYCDSYLQKLPNAASLGDLCSLAREYYIQQSKKRWGKKG